MQIIERKLKGVFEFNFEPIKDNRGFFMRVMDINLLNEFGLNKIWVQENHSCNTNKGIIRGLHFQFPPYTETKLVRAIKGEILDVFVDLREGSPTLGNWDSIILSENNYKAIYIPRGFAHGFCTLTDHSELIYKVDNYYSKQYESGILWNDSNLNIDWPVSREKVIISERDRGHITFKEFLTEHNGVCKF